MWEEGRALTSQLRGPELRYGPGARATRAGPQLEFTPTCKSGDQAKPGGGGVVLGGGCRWGEGQLLFNVLLLLSSLRLSPGIHQPPTLWRPGQGTGPQSSHLRSEGRGGKDQVQESLLVTNDLTSAIHLNSMHHLPQVLEAVLPEGSIQAVVQGSPHSTHLRTPSPKPPS